MKRYALPLGIVGFIIIVFALVFWGGGSALQYTDGDAREPSRSDEWVRGNASSTVTLIEYSDFQCPACRAYYGMLNQLESEFGDRVAFIYRHYPLYQIHPHADAAARASEAAGVQGKFWQMHDMLFENQSVWSSLLSPDATFEKYAGELGLDTAKFKIDMESDALQKRVADDYQRGARIGVTGTPTFVINGVKLTQNPASLDEFRFILNAAIPVKSVAQ